MVGLVIVSHSNAISRALVDLVRQVTAKEIPIAAVGGVGVDRKEFGTDAVDIVEAIESVYSADGVAVLMDLGSAILSAETAVELLPENMQHHIRMCAAPIVEGAVSAAVQISLGSDLEAVCREAAQALMPKRQHLADSDEKQADAAASGQEQTQLQQRREIRLIVTNAHGLHARPAARFVQTAAAFDARIWVKKVDSPRDPVSAGSLTSLATLGVKRDDSIVVSAAGPDAGKALAAISMLINEELPAAGAETTPAPESNATPAAGAKGRTAVALSEGIAVGPIFHFRTCAPQVPRRRAADPESEWQNLLRAIDKACGAIRRRRQAMEAGLGQAKAAIFEAHILILQDPALLDRVRQRILADGENAAWAWQESVQEIADSYRKLTDEYLKQRADDVADVGRQVLSNLLGQSAATAVKLPHQAIVVAAELTPTDTALLDTKQVLGIATVAGGPSSHSAILARALGIPAIAGIDPGLLNLANDTVLALDGFSGTLWIEPSPKVIADLKAHRRRWLRRRSKLRASGRQPAVTRDGRRITVAANLGSVHEAAKALENGADGVGLLRTEFLYLRRRRPPAEAEQVDILRRIAGTLDGKPICVRTLDAGGDKPLPYLRLPAESNPYLGLRAVRLSLQYPELFRIQLRAILRAGERFDLRLMFPMISRAEEVDQLLEIRDAVHRELAETGITHRWPIPTGIMIETPAAALLISSFANRLDFFSIGTNDLTQYTLAAERGNANLADYADALHPAILQLIRQVVDEAHRHGKPVAVCGEMAADPVAVPVLVGLGVDELSLTPDAIAGVKAAVRKMAHNRAIELVQKMLATDSAGSARRLAADFLKSKE
jgi:phosphocarrier protein FPr